MGGHGIGGACRPKPSPIYPHDYGVKNFATLFETTGLFQVLRIANGQSYVADKRDKERTATEPTLESGRHAGAWEWSLCSDESLPSAWSLAIASVSDLSQRTRHFVCATLAAKGRLRNGICRNFPQNSGLSGIANIADIRRDA